MAVVKKPSTDAEKPKEGIKQAYHVQWQLSHDGTDYQADDVVDLSDDDAQPLLACGVIQLAGEQ